MDYKINQHNREQKSKGINDGNETERERQRYRYREGTIYVDRNEER